MTSTIITISHKGNDWELSVVVVSEHSIVVFSELSVVVVSELAFVGLFVEETFEKLVEVLVETLIVKFRDSVLFSFLQPKNLWKFIF